MIYDIEVIIPILTANVLNATIKTLPLTSIYHSACMEVHSPLSPGTQTYFFDVITTDTHKDGWITIYPPPQQRAHPLNYPYTPLHRQTGPKPSYSKTNTNMRLQL